MKRFYKVADHVFSVDSDIDTPDWMCNYSPFETAEDKELFSLAVRNAIVERADFTEEFHQEEEGFDISCGYTDTGQDVFEFSMGNQLIGSLVCAKDHHDATLVCDDAFKQKAVDNSLMILYALNTATLGTALFHASVIQFRNKAYLFLGKSGTGKSTHASLWLQYIPQTELLNDDNPVVRIVNEEIWVCGSPWSGKTPCYKNEKYLLGGIVDLSQAPFNEIRPLRGIEAYAVLVPSISGKRWDKDMADGLHDFENHLALKAPIWHLSCLPDEEAAKICAKHVVQ